MLGRRKEVGSRRFLELSLVIVFLCAPILAFSGGQSAPAEKQVLIYNSNWSDEQYRIADSEVVSMFQAQNPNVKIIHSVISDEDFKQAIRAYLQAKPGPDVLTWYAGNRARFFIGKGLILDISDVYKQEGWYSKFSEAFVNLSTMNGKQYFVPTNWYWWAVFYRKSVFQKLALSTPKTWDDFLKVCEKIKQSGMSPITIGTKWSWTTGGWFDYLNMRLNGADFHLSLCDGEQSYTDPRVLKVFTDYWGPLIKKGYFIPDGPAYSWQEAINLMVTGKAAMYLMGQFIATAWPQEIIDDLDFFQFPIIDPKVPIAEDAPTDGVFASTNAANPQMAKKFLAFLGSAPAQQVWVKRLGRLATHKDVDQSLYSPYQRKGISLINTAKMLTQFYDRDTTPPMAERGMDSFMEFWANPDDVDTIMARLDEQRKEFFGKK